MKIMIFTQFPKSQNSFFLYLYLLHIDEHIINNLIKINCFELYFLLCVIGPISNIYGTT